jgi:hypothetical protein
MSARKGRGCLRGMGSSLDGKLSLFAGGRPGVSLHLLRHREDYATDQIPAFAPTECRYPAQLVGE